MKSEVESGRSYRAFVFNTECMKFLEKDLEQIIYEADKKSLRARGLYVLSSQMRRQVKIGNYGIADLVSIERPYKDEYQYWRGTITVYELKQNKIGISAFLQALGYVKGIQRYLEKRGFPIYLFDFRIVLIGDSIDTSSTYCYLADYLIYNEFNEQSPEQLPRIILSNYTYSYDIDGIRFENHDGFCLTNEGF